MRLYSVMQDACDIISALMKRPETNFQLSRVIENFITFIQTFHTLGFFSTTPPPPPPLPASLLISSSLKNEISKKQRNQRKFNLLNLGYNLISET